MIYCYIHKMFSALLVLILIISEATSVLRLQNILHSPLFDERTVKISAVSRTNLVQVQKLSAFGGSDKILFEPSNNSVVWEFHTVDNTTSKFIRDRGIYINYHDSLVQEKREISEILHNQNGLRYSQSSVEISNGYFGFVSEDFAILLLNNYNYAQIAASYEDKYVNGPKLLKHVENNCFIYVTGDSKIKVVNEWNLEYIYTIDLSGKQLTKISYIDYYFEKSSQQVTFIAKAIQVSEGSPMVYCVFAAKIDENFTQVGRFYKPEGEGNIYLTGPNSGVTFNLTKMKKWSNLINNFTDQITVQEQVQMYEESEQLKPSEYVYGQPSIFNPHGIVLFIAGHYLYKFVDLAPYKKADKYLISSEAKTCHNLGISKDKKYIEVSCEKYGLANQVQIILLQIYDPSKRRLTLNSQKAIGFMGMSSFGQIIYSTDLRYDLFMVYRRQRLSPHNLSRIQNFDAKPYSFSEQEEFLVFVGPSADQTKKIAGERIIFNETKEIFDISFQSDFQLVPLILGDILVVVYEKNGNKILYYEVFQKTTTVYQRSNILQVKDTLYHQSLIIMTEDNYQFLNVTTNKSLIIPITNKYQSKFLSASKNGIDYFVMAKSQNQVQLIYIADSEVKQRFSFFLQKENSQNLTGIFFTEDNSLYLSTSNGKLYHLTQKPCPQNFFVHNSRCTCFQNYTNFEDKCVCLPPLRKDGNQCSCPLPFIYTPSPLSCICKQGSYEQNNSCSQCGLFCSRCSKGGALDCDHFGAIFYLFIIALILIVISLIAISIVCIRRRIKQKNEDKMHSGQYMEI